MDDVAFHNEIRFWGTSLPEALPGSTFVNVIFASNSLLAHEVFTCSLSHMAKFGPWSSLCFAVADDVVLVFDNSVV